ncbi:MAG: hypothetical protein EA351_12320 [Gemmatimonadales bacterium]|nr:MAG: hypothetical protein EA351_12320 [Gemmatimonadales bacterium]
MRVNNSVEVRLGRKDEVEAILSYVTDSSVTVYETCAQGFCQSLLRDLKYASWAVVRPKKGGDPDEYWVHLTSPNQDLGAYVDAIPAFMGAAAEGLRIYRAHKAAIDGLKLFFFPPQGMTLAETRSVQLLHYPPYEARAFCDYLYSPTNRRYEGLLDFNGYPPEKVSLLERICDLVPLAGPGDVASGIDQFNEVFMPYTRLMLGALLDGSGSHTQPVVAYGSPVHEWLPLAYPDQIKGPLGLYSIVSPRLTDSDAVTHMVCANHPSEFLFFSEHDWEWAVKMTLEDLVTSRWQVVMSEDWSADPHDVLRDCQDYWNARPANVADICRIQEEAYSFDL